MIIDIHKASTILKKGGIVIFPTDTAFGIGCRIDNPESVGKLFRLRNRPVTRATPVLVDSIEMIKEYTTSILPLVEDTLMKRYWPGALTIILPAINEKIPSLVRGGTDTIGVRIPDHNTALSLIKAVGVPIIGTSANFHGKNTPYQLSDLDPKLVSLVDGVVDGECTVRKESTVVDCTFNPWRIVRQGAIVLDE